MLTVAGVAGILRALLILLIHDFEIIIAWRGQTLVLVMDLLL